MNETPQVHSNSQLAKYLDILFYFIVKKLLTCDSGLLFNFTILQVFESDNLSLTFKSFWQSELNVNFAEFWLPALTSLPSSLIRSYKSCYWLIVCARQKTVSYERYYNSDLISKKHNIYSNLISLTKI